MVPSQMKDGTFEWRQKWKKRFRYLLLVLVGFSEYFRWCFSFFTKMCRYREHVVPKSSNRFLHERSHLDYNVHSVGLQKLSHAWTIDWQVWNTYLHGSFKVVYCVDILRNCVEFFLSVNECEFLFIFSTNFLTCTWYLFFLENNN